MGIAEAKLRRGRHGLGLLLSGKATRTRLGEMSDVSGRMMDDQAGSDKAIPLWR